MLKKFLNDKTHKYIKKESSTGSKLGIKLEIKALTKNLKSEMKKK